MEKTSTLLVVNDLRISKAFYIDALGFEVIEEYDDCIKLNVGNNIVLMFEGERPLVGYEHGFNANSTVVFTVENLDKKIEEFKSKGIVFIHEVPNENRWGRYAAFKDPSGIIHELMEFYS